ncbi:regulatory subunit [Chlorella sorokiniana]|uniref:Regulatory subunit n=1 Tax=Chlorella sorokiniana TaxID=3076 RepID=A0A2P6TTU7_CHLSO|nr:regulatory subunit [Chlorella sorokiniana]|eukprot:PRW57473.1 regulatory subunit [Chlorella sorokiniana]
MAAPAGLPVAGLPPPPALAAASGAPRWGALPEPLLLLILSHLADDNDPALAAAHLVSRAWRHGAQLAARSLRFAGAPPDTERLRLAFPYVNSLTLERMQLAPKQMANVAGLTRLTVLHMRLCRLSEGASVLALQRLPQLQALELSDVAGPTAAQLDDTLRSLTALHRLAVFSHSPACKTPALRSLACLPRMRRLAVAQAHQLQSFVGLTNLGSLQDLEALELRGAGVTNSIMARLAALPSFAQLRVPDAGLVTDEGLAALAALPLQDLDLSCRRAQADEPVSDAGMAHLAALSQLTRLDLSGRTAVTAQGLSPLRTFTRLQHLDLSRLQLASGDASFLWCLTQLTTLRVVATQMRAEQFAGLSSLGALAELDASGTGFDDGCCAELVPLAGLTNLNLSHTAITGAGLKQLGASHAKQLAHLQIDGCCVSTWALLSVLRRQPGGSCMWDPEMRGHLPRPINLANLLLMTPARNGSRLWRLRHAPEANLLARALMVCLAASLLLSHMLLCVLTSAGLMLLPLIFTCVGAAMLFRWAIGRPLSQRPLLTAAVKGEVLLSAILMGPIATIIPPPPIAAHAWEV